MYSTWNKCNVLYKEYRYTPLSMVKECTRHILSFSLHVWLLIFKFFLLVFCFDTLVVYLNITVLPRVLSF